MHFCVTILTQIQSSVCYFTTWTIQIVIRQLGAASREKTKKCTHFQNIKQKKPPIAGMIANSDRPKTSAWHEIREFVLNIFVVFVIIVVAIAALGNTWKGLLSIYNYNSDSKFETARPPGFDTPCEGECMLVFKDGIWKMVPVTTPHLTAESESPIERHPETKATA